MTQPISAGALDAALDYARKHQLHALLVRCRGETLAEEYAAGYDAQKPHALYSGTKSFWGLCACTAAEDGLLHLDEPVAETIPQWRADSGKALVTIRQLLSLTAGIPFGGLGAGVPTYEAALAKPLANEPGTKFTYGGIPLQVFGAVLARKLAGRALTPHEYLRQRILDPVGVEIGSWRALKDGTLTLPTGAFLAAPQWAKYGELLASGGVWNGKRVVSEAAIAQCFEPGIVNPKYGLGFWLQPSRNEAPFVAYASGSGKQALYVVPGLGVTVVHFSNSTSYKHETFLARLFKRPAGALLEERSR